MIEHPKTVYIVSEYLQELLPIWVRTAPDLDHGASGVAELGISKPKRCWVTNGKWSTEMLEPPKARLGST